ALLDDDRLMGLTVHTAVCIVPVYNVSGARQRGPNSRVNQNGPEEYGFRGNARNLDLNRDMMKADSRNAEALIKALARWDPDIYFETHVSNGADHRYVMELLTTHPDKLDPPVREFLSRSLLPALQEWMEAKEIPMCPYFELIEDSPEEGMTAFVDGPRYSTGYNALLGRIGILSETHMLKPYADRVNATLQLMLATLALMDRNRSELSAVKSMARQYIASTTDQGCNWKVDTTRVTALDWKGFAHGTLPSAVSGLPRSHYDHDRPTRSTVPWMAHAVPTLLVRKPKAYIVPQAWRGLIERIAWSGAPMRMLTADTSLNAEVMYIEQYNTVQRPYEGHYLHYDITTTLRNETVRARAGDVLVPMGHGTDRLVVELLEPRASDGCFAWGFFDSILQQKEWFSDYVFEDIAEGLLERDVALKAALEARRAADPAFAQDAFAQLYFIYQRSPYFEPGFKRYPVVRVAGP
ncbi:MAG: hypothetical protein KDB84_11025, partial [Flavobacteriales bacterium]|nr:hypothetical protein [Flavobacteriales bacterium]